MISMIASVGKNRELGIDNHLIWKIPRDMKFFRDTTMGHKVIMGRKTYESLPGYLPGREMIVLDFNKVEGNVSTMYSVEEVLDNYLDSPEEVFIIGGTSIYKQFIKYATRLYLTEIDESCHLADVYFPEFNKRNWSREVITSGEWENIKFTMCKYTKNK